MIYIPVEAENLQVRLYASGEHATIEVLYLFSANHSISALRGRLLNRGIYPMSTHCVVYVPFIHGLQFVACNTIFGVRIPWPWESLDDPYGFIFRGRFQLLGGEVYNPSRKTPQKQSGTPLTVVCLPDALYDERGGATYYFVRHYPHFMSSLRHLLTFEKTQKKKDNPMVADIGILPRKTLVQWRSDDTRVGWFRGYGACPGRQKICRYAFMLLENMPR